MMQHLTYFLGYIRNKSALLDFDDWCDDRIFLYDPSQVCIKPMFENMVTKLKKCNSALQLTIIDFSQHHDFAQYESDTFITSLEDALVYLKELCAEKMKRLENQTLGQGRSTGELLKPYCECDASPYR